MKLPYFIVATVCIIVAFGLGIFLFSPKQQPNTTLAPSSSVQSIRMVTIRDVTVTVDLARTPEQLAQGLSGRPNLGETEGMLFLFPDMQQRWFWMKDMHFPLDMIWIADDTIMAITENVPAPENLSAENLATLPQYASTVPVNRVLEVNAGFVAKHGIKIGDYVEYKE